MSVRSVTLGRGLDAEQQFELGEDGCEHVVRWALDRLPHPRVTQPKLHAQLPHLLDNGGALVGAQLWCDRVGQPSNPLGCLVGEVSCDLFFAAAVTSERSHHAMSPARAMTESLKKGFATVSVV